MSTQDTLKTVNEALARLGSAPIAALDEETPKAAKVAQIYPTVVGAAFACHRWNWARRTARLDRLAVTPETGWRYAYALPGDRIGEPVTIEGVLIRPGDLIVADGSGAVDGVDEPGRLLHGVLGGPGRGDGGRAVGLHLAAPRGDELRGGLEQARGLVDVRPDGRKRLGGVAGAQPCEGLLGRGEATTDLADPHVEVGEDLGRAALQVSQAHELVRLRVELRVGLGREGEDLLQVRALGLALDPFAVHPVLHGERLGRLPPRVLQGRAELLGLLTAELRLGEGQLLARGTDGVVEPDECRGRAPLEGLQRFDLLRRERPAVGSVGDLLGRLRRAALLPAEGREEGGDDEDGGAQEAQPAGDRGPADTTGARAAAGAAGTAFLMTFLTRGTKSGAAQGMNEAAATAHGAHWAFLFAGVLSLVVVVLAPFLKRVPSGE